MGVAIDIIQPPETVSAGEEWERRATVRATSEGESITLLVRRVPGEGIIVTPEEGGRALTEEEFWAYQWVYQWSEHILQECWA